MFFSDLYSYLYQIGAIYLALVSGVAFSILQISEKFAPKFFNKIEKSFPPKKQKIALLIVTVVIFCIAPFKLYHDAKNQLRVFQEKTVYVEPSDIRIWNNDENSTLSVSLRNNGLEPITISEVHFELGLRGEEKRRIEYTPYIEHPRVFTLGPKDDRGFTADAFPVNHFEEMNPGNTNPYIVYICFKYKLGKEKNPSCAPIVRYEDRFGKFDNLGGLADTKDW